MSYKIFMWRNIGLSDWLFDSDQEAEILKYVLVVLATVKNSAEVKAKIVNARRFIIKRNRETLLVLHEELKI